MHRGSGVGWGIHFDQGCLLCELMDLSHLRVPHKEVVDLPQLSPMLESQQPLSTVDRSRSQKQKSCYMKTTEGSQSLACLPTASC